MSLALFSTPNSIIALRPFTTIGLLVSREESIFNSVVFLDFLVLEFNSLNISLIFLFAFIKKANRKFHIIKIN